MSGGVTYIHTIPALVQRFEELTQQYLPGIRANHVVESAYFDAEYRSRSWGLSGRRDLLLPGHQC